jgi:3',5'-nucleoside bisphosphate phosphatase
VALVAKARDLRLRVLSVTDHDSTAAYPEIQTLAKETPPLEIIPGIEMSAEGELYCHLLGYWVRMEAAAFQEKLTQLRHKRRDRAAQMTQKINAMGMAVDFERVLVLAQGGSVGRPHIADAMVEKAHVRTRQEAFDRFLKRDGPAYVPGVGMSAAEAIAFIRSAGGVPVLAHPSYYMSPELLKRLVDLGLMGLEVYYPDHSRSLTRRYLELAESHGLVVTGGSDFHGPKTQRPSLGCVEVPASVVESLSEARNRV